MHHVVGPLTAQQRTRVRPNQHPVSAPREATGYTPFLVLPLQIRRDDSQVLKVKTTEEDTGKCSMVFALVYIGWKARF
jgi:hypothetical protein